MGGFAVNPQKRKGDRAELEVQGMWRDHCGVFARRALGAGRKDDVGDIHGIPDTVCQVVDYQDITRAIREKVPKCVEQQERAKATFGATFVRLRGGDFRVVMTPDQFFALWREAQ
jgi:hypothetical protein